MSFRIDLRDLISSGDQFNELMRGLMQAIEDHGGSSHHLNGLLSDARGERKWFDQLAKQLIGPIWELADNPVGLHFDPDDFTISWQDFVERYSGSGLAFANAIYGLDDYHEVEPWSETSPIAHCQYQLRHSRHPQQIDEVLSRHARPAGWRELAVYASRLKPENIEGFTLIAAGSRCLDLKEDGSKVLLPTFPSATVWNGKIEMSWRGLKRPDSVLDTQCFYLVRV